MVTIMGASTSFSDNSNPSFNTLRTQCAHIKNFLQKKIHRHCSPEAGIGNLDDGSWRQLEGGRQYLAIRDAAMSRLSTASGRLAVSPQLPTCALVHHSSVGATVVGARVVGWAAHLAITSRSHL